MHTDWPRALDRYYWLLQRVEGTQIMKIVVKELTPGRWIIQLVSSLAASSGRTTYPSKEAAVAEAERQHPGKQITIE